MDRKLIVLGVAGLILATGVATLAACGPGGGSSTPGDMSTTMTATITPTAGLTTVPVSAPTPVVAPSQRVEFLQEIDHVGVPRSASGNSEVLIGQGVCAQLALGRDLGSIATELARAVPLWTREQAMLVSTAARGALCRP